jgi:hypothetical protein
METTMWSRNVLALLLAAALAPATARGQDREWEEDYTDTWADEDAGREPVDVQVDVDAAPSATQESFDAGLAPHGSWVTSSRYGRIWHPRVAAGWRPYYFGRWEWTNEGWLWVSDEPFGWAVYHYGRWAWDDPWGWVWVPGYQWAPAWVTWRTSGDVIGWAPLGPGFSLYVTSYPFVDFYWTFVPTVRFVSYPVYSCAYAPSHSRQFFYRTAPAPARPAPRPGVVARTAPRPAWGGPSPRTIEQRLGRAISPVRVVPAPSPGAVARPGEVAIYRPGRPAGRVDGGERRAPVMRPAPGSREVVPSRGWRPQAEQRGSPPRAEPRQAPRAEPRQAPRAEPRQAPRAEPRQAPRAEPRGESRRSEGGARAAPAPARGGDGRRERR